MLRTACAHACPTGASESQARMAPRPQLTVDCQIVGQASPRWRAAGSESQRVDNNEALSLRRADAVRKEFEAALVRELRGYQLKFIDNVSFADDEQPDQSVVIGAEALGQRDSIVLAGGDRMRDDPQYRRTDIVVRIARSTQDSMPTKVRQTWQRSTKSKFWYVSVAVSGSVDVVFGVTLLRLKLQNWMGDEAQGMVSALSGGAGLKVGYSPYSWSSPTSFMTDREVGFDDFHGVHVRYTSTGIVLGVGYSVSYLTFYGMGSDAASLSVGGWNAGFDVSASIADGFLLLDMVPGDYTIEHYDITEWNAIRSDWITKQRASIYFDTAASSLNPDQVAQVRRFAAAVAKDILST